MKDETARWVEIAENDLRAAESLFEQDFYPHAIFWCEQAIELLLKALWVETLPSQPPKTHGLEILRRRLELGVTDAAAEFLKRLELLYVGTRYPDASFSFVEEDARRYLEETKEFFAWLRALLI